MSYVLPTIPSPGKFTYSSACGLSSLVFAFLLLYNSDDQPTAAVAMGVIFIVLVGLLFFQSLPPQPFTALMPPGEDFDDFEGFTPAATNSSKFLQSLGPYSPAVFVLFQNTPSGGCSLSRRTNRGRRRIRVRPNHGLCAFHVGTHHRLLGRIRALVSCGTFCRAICQSGGAKQV